LSLKPRAGMIFLLFLVLIGFSLILFGCSKQEAATETGSAGLAPAPDAGKLAFNSNGCARCHSIGGSGGHMGPDLTHEGADSSHTAQWIADQIKNPKSHNPGSRMPPFEGRISDQDLQALSSYLAGLK
jgi:mono/diheme cytochrome c family protein